GGGGGATQPVALGCARAAACRRAALPAPRRGGRRAVSPVTAGPLASPRVRVEIARAGRERRGRCPADLGPARRRRAQELRGLEPDDPHSLELVRHLGGGRERLRTEQLVAQEIADVPRRRAPARRSRHDVGGRRLETTELCAPAEGAGLRDAGIRERQGRGSLGRRILHQVAGEMVRGRLRKRRRGEGHQSHERQQVREDAVHGTSFLALEERARHMPPTPLHHAVAAKRPAPPVVSLLPPALRQTCRRIGTNESLLAAQTGEPFPHSSIIAGNGDVRRGPRRVAPTARRLRWAYYTCCGSSRTLVERTSRSPSWGWWARRREPRPGAK